MLFMHVFEVTYKHLKRFYQAEQLLLEPVIIGKQSTLGATFRRYLKNGTTFWNEIFTYYY